VHSRLEKHALVRSSVVNATRLAYTIKLSWYALVVTQTAQFRSFDVCEHEYDLAYQPAILPARRLCGAVCQAGLCVQCAYFAFETLIASEVANIKYLAFETLKGRPR
jgi:hypothetical protein